MALLLPGLALLLASEFAFAAAVLRLTRSPGVAAIGLGLLLLRTRPWLADTGLFTVNTDWLASGAFGLAVSLLIAGPGAAPSRRRARLPGARPRLARRESHDIRLPARRCGAAPDAGTASHRLLARRRPLESGARRGRRRACSGPPRHARPCRRRGSGSSTMPWRVAATGPCAPRSSISRAVDLGLPFVAAASVVLSGAIVAGLTAPAGRRRHARARAASRRSRLSDRSPDRARLYPDHAAVRESDRLRSRRHSPDGPADDGPRGARCAGLQACRGGSRGSRASASSRSAPSCRGAHPRSAQPRPDCALSRARRRPG